MDHVDISGKVKRFSKSLKYSHTQKHFKSHLLICIRTNSSPWFDLIWFDLLCRRNTILHWWPTIFILRRNRLSLETPLKELDQSTIFRSGDIFHNKFNFWIYLLVVSMCSTLGKNVCTLQVFPFTSSKRVPVMNMIIFLKSESLKISTTQNVFLLQSSFSIWLPPSREPFPPWTWLSLQLQRRWRGKKRRRRWVSYVWWGKKTLLEIEILKKTMILDLKCKRIQDEN